MNAETPDEITDLETAPIPQIADIPSAPLEAPPPTIPLAPEDQLARKPTLDLSRARFPTMPLSRLAMVYRSATFPLIRLSRSSVLVERKTVRLTSDPVNLLQAELRRARRRVRILGGALVIAGTLLLLITLYLWRHAAFSR